MNIKRLSPVQFSPRAVRRSERGHWEIVETYQGEKPDFALVDLSHAPKWELQDTPAALAASPEPEIPTTPGQVSFAADLAVCRLTGSRALVWDFATEDHWRPSKNTFTDTTDGQCLLFLTGPAWASVMQRLCALDLVLPQNRPNDPPWAFWQGPVLDIPAKLLLCHPQNGRPGLFIAVARGFGQSLADALLKAGTDQQLAPGGEALFRGWWQTWLETPATD